MRKLFRSMLSLLLIIALVGSNAAFGACFTASAASSTLQVLTSGVVPSMRIQYDLPYKLGGAGTHVRLADNPINVFRFNGQMAYCIEPDGYTQGGLEYDSASGTASTDQYWTHLQRNYPKIATGITRAVAIADYINPTKDVDVQASAQVVIWEIVCGYRDPVTGEVTDTRFRDVFTNKAGDFYWTERYNAMDKALRTFETIPSFMKMERGAATNNPINLEWSDTAKRYEATLTDTNKMLSSMGDIDAAFGGAIHVERNDAANTLTLWTTAAFDGVVCSSRVNKNHGFDTSETPSYIIWGKQMDVKLQTLMSASIPDPAAAYVAVQTSGQPHTDITGQKSWYDLDNQHNTRPASITVHLVAKGTIVDSQIVTEESGWTWTFYDKPLYDENGEEIPYYVIESPLAGYSAIYDNDSYDIANLYFPVYLRGEKTWDDANNQDGIRPKYIGIAVYANGEFYTYTMVTEADGWKWELVLPAVDKDGNEIVWTMEEIVPEGYKATYNGYNITNTHTPEVILLSDDKVWDDGGDQDGIRPQSITVRLHADGVEIDHQVVTADNDWTWTFADLPKFRDGGIEIQYEITEDPVPGYETYIDGFNIINTHVPETIEISGSKTWDDANNRDGIRPESIILHLYADGEEVASQIVTEAENWSWTFTDLPKYRDGGIEVQYELREDPVLGYETTINGFDITNTHVPATKGVEGYKVWDDADDQDGIRADSITIRLLADGVEIDSRVVSAADGWKWNFTDLPVYRDGGIEVNYEIREDAVPGYETTINGYTVKNTHVPETTDVNGSKTWNDNNNQDGVRAEAITIRLLADGAEIQSKVITAADGWAWSFTDLPKYRDGGVEIRYEIREDAVEDYQTEINGFDVINTHAPDLTTVSGSKTWNDADNQDGIRADSITVRLFADGVEIDHKVVTEADGWTWQWTDLPKYRDGGTEVQYEIREDAVEGYETIINGFDIINTHIPAQVKVSGTKTWIDNNDQDGIRADSITVRLFADGVEIDHKVVTEADGWKWEFDNLPEFRDGGVKVQYTLREDHVDGYQTEINDFDITNTHAPETTTVEGTKTWIDNNDQDGIRADSITVRLFADGVEIDHKVVTEADGWSWTWTDLPVYRDGGIEIQYEITEDEVEGYQTMINGFDITNTHIAQVKDIEGSKTWIDNNDQDGIRADSITVRLFADGVEIDHKVVTEADGWSWTWTDLPVYRDGGIEVSYEIREDAVEGYETAINGFNITNTHIPEITDVEGSKTWDDASDRDGYRPDEITIRLWADGAEIDHKIVTEADGWSWRWTELPKYRDGGVLIEYAITEDAIEHYETVINGFDVTNIHVPETITITGHKIWNDGANADALRPSEVTVRLYANDVEVDSVVVYGDANTDTWEYTFTDLPAYENGERIEYTVREDAVDHYVATVQGYDIVNTHVPESPKTGEDPWQLPIAFAVMAAAGFGCLFMGLIARKKQARQELRWK